MKLPILIALATLPLAAATLSPDNSGGYPVGIDHQPLTDETYVFFGYPGLQPPFEHFDPTFYEADLGFYTYDIPIDTAWSFKCWDGDGNYVECDGFMAADPGNSDAYLIQAQLPLDANIDPATATEFFIHIETDGNPIYVTSPSFIAVPEPGTWWMVIGGLVGVALWRRRGPVTG